MMRRSRRACGLLVLTVLLAGCAKFSTSKTVSVGPNKAEAVFALPIPTGDEKFTITAEAPDGEVAIYLAATGDAANSVVESIDEAKPPDEKLVLFKSNKGPKATLEATAHAKDDLTVIVANYGKTSAEVKITAVGK
jgi:hypothetical protein